MRRVETPWFIFAAAGALSALGLALALLVPADPDQLNLWSILHFAGWVLCFIFAFAILTTPLRYEFEGSALAVVKLIFGRVDHDLDQAKSIRVDRFGRVQIRFPDRKLTISTGALPREDQDWVRAYFRERMKDG